MADDDAIAKNRRPARPDRRQHGDRLRAGRAGLVQRVDRAGPDAADRRRRADAARVRPRGDLAERASRPAAQRPDAVQGHRPLLRRQRVPRPDLQPRPAGVPDAPRPGRSATPPRTRTSRTASGSPTDRRRDARGRQRRRLLPQPRRRRPGAEQRRLGQRRPDRLPTRCSRTTPPWPTTAPSTPGCRTTAS